jgi:transposase-like protein
MREELLKGLTEEQIKKVHECDSVEEILALAKAEGVELNDEQLEAINGGCSKAVYTCPQCGSRDISVTKVPFVDYCVCRKCGYNWTAS